MGGCVGRVVARFCQISLAFLANLPRSNKGDFLLLFRISLTICCVHVVPYLELGGGGRGRGKGGRGGRGVLIRHWL